MQLTLFTSLYCLDHCTAIDVFEMQIIIQIQLQLDARLFIGVAAHMKTLLPLKDNHRALGISLLEGPVGGVFANERSTPVQGLLEIKDTHRPYGGFMLLGLSLP